MRGRVGFWKTISTKNTEHPKFKKLDPVFTQPGCFDTDAMHKTKTIKWDFKEQREFQKSLNFEGL